MKKILLLYVPVLHEGYIKLFKKYRGKVDGLYLLGEDIVEEFFPLHKEIRALDPKTAKKAVETFNFFPVVKVADKKSLTGLKRCNLVVADEDISRSIVHTYFPKSKVRFEKIFLRWDGRTVQKANAVAYDRISKDFFDRKMCKMAANEAEKSSDWWRHVGAVATKNKKILFQAHNHHVPSEHMPYVNGDPRDVVKAGTLNLVYTSLHAEQSIIAEAARKGISLLGTSIYMNIFPCPLCAKLMAYSGIKKCFFRTGSNWLDAESVLRANGVEIILVR